MTEKKGKKTNFCEVNKMIIKGFVERISWEIKFCSTEQLVFLLQSSPSSHEMSSPLANKTELWFRSTLASVRGTRSAFKQSGKED